MRRRVAEEEPSDEEKIELAATNHTCNGISVSGINLPWYVQFRAASGENYEFSNEAEANLFKSYEFELWDLKNNTEYEIPDGEYISVTVPVKAGYDYTIEHLLDSGAMETIDSECGWKYYGIQHTFIQSVWNRRKQDSGR